MALALPTLATAVWQAVMVTPGCRYPPGGYYGTLGCIGRDVTWLAAT
jgi:hypothetical protein